MTRSRAPIRIRCVTPQLIHKDEFIGRIVDALNYLRMEVIKVEQKVSAVTETDGPTNQKTHSNIERIKRSH